MKKLHKKIIRLQAKALVRLANQIVSIKKGRKISSKYNTGSSWYMYSRKQRSELQEINGWYYQPDRLKGLVKGVRESKKAKLYRGLLANAKMRDDIPFYGNFYNFKQYMCKSLIKQQIQKETLKQVSDTLKEIVLFNEQLA